MMPPSGNSMTPLPLRLEGVARPVVAAATPFFLCDAKRARVQQLKACARVLFSR